MIPQLIYLALSFMGIGMAIKEHGEEKKGKHNAWISLISALICWCILYSGGFFDILLKK